MRKILVPLVAGLMLFALAGCGNSNNSFLETEEGNKPSEIEGNMITSVENGNLSTDSAVLLCMEICEELMYNFDVRSEQQIEIFGGKNGVFKR